MPNDFTPTVDIGEWVRANSEHLYKTNRVVLRETLQNAIDALRMGSRLPESARRVEIDYDPVAQKLTIRDSGIGMTLGEQIECFWKPYGSSKRNLSENSRMREGIIGRFGIGAYTSFRVAKQVVVISKSASVPNSIPMGTMATLERDLGDYASSEIPKIGFRNVGEKDIAAEWPQGMKHGTIVIMYLVEELDEDEGREWLMEASTYLNESVIFQGERLHDHPKMLPKLIGSNIKTIKFEVSDLCPDSRVQRLDMKIRIKDNGDAAVEICSVCLLVEGNSLELECGGVLRLSPRDFESGVTLLKHNFHFAEIENTRSWVSSVSTDENNDGSFRFTGILDLPFLDPDSAREGFSEEGQVDMSSIFVSASAVILEEIGQRGGKCLHKCEQIFSMLYRRSHGKREAVLRTYPFRLFPSKSNVTLEELKRQYSDDDEIKTVFLTDDADTRTEELAKSLSTLENYRVIKLDSPYHWRGYVLKQVLEGCFGANNIADATSFVSALDESELGSWREYRAAFTAVLDKMIGAGHQVILARIEPKTVAVVVQEGTSIVYLNHYNEEVANLPDANLFGLSLEAKIRSWLYGKIEAAKMEEAMVKEGKLLIVQKVVKVHYVEQSEIERYVPGPDHQFLFVKKDKENHFALRVSSLCHQNLRRFVDNSGRLKAGFSTQLSWVGSIFHFVITSTDVMLPTLILTFHTGIVLRNSEKDDSVDGRTPFQLSFDVFKGPHLDGLVFFFALPKWLGLLFETERSKNGSLMISMWSQIVFSDENALEV